MDIGELWIALSKITCRGNYVASDYHQILGVPQDANMASIKLAYRRLARRYHPDVSSEPDASERFAAITEAYRALHAEQILKENRHKVQNAPNRMHKNTEHSPSGSTTTDNTTDNTGNRTGAASDSPDRPSVSKEGNLTDCELTAHLSIEELYWGVELKIDPSTQCPGRRRRDHKTSKLLRVKLRRGTRSGQRLRIKEPDARSENQHGAIYLTVHLKPHERYDIVDNNLYVDLPLSSWEAQNGAIVDLITPGGRVDVGVPPGISSGQSIRIPRRGLPRSDTEYGDLFAVARIVSLDERTRKLRQWPHTAHRDIRHWRPVGGYKAGAGIDVHA